MPRTHLPTRRPAFAPIHPARPAQKAAEIRDRVTQGKTRQDIGDVLGSSPRTVSTHREHVLEKRGMETRSAATNLVMRRTRSGST
ncbi:LuxR C-terminal-related transcriptional regulator [Zoogloea sp.]|uniref:LuxR C-terminal-related transcriptional regulator n=1 Tax=Zoogloea sp. TaxID=49181 RepID=UPI002BDA7508|nr:LuxR C-terminal-related transcriptional regulator [Zoogloea sp.]HNH16392.1 LuxR C-terminal-related transcriptional regulator [Zoogloea sp.]